MIPHYQIPRNVLLWIFVSQFLVFLPHINRTPIWIGFLWAMCVFWRIQVFKGRWSFPNKKIKGFLLVSTVIGLVASFPGFFGLEALVSTLLAAYGLKLLEMYKKRDALILLYLSFFVLMTGFLFEQAIWLALFNTFTLVVVLTAIIGLYQTDGQAEPGNDFRRASAIVLQAIPVMVLMFVALPRFPSFWSIPLQKNTPKTGMSDSMSPGDFTHLAQSADPVMRISFNGIPPAKEDLYWRGLVFTDFDGVRWQPDDRAWLRQKGFVGAVLNQGNQREFYQKVEQVGITPRQYAPITYEVILEPHQTPWLYALSAPIPETEGIWLTYEQIIAKNGNVQNRFKYTVATGNLLKKALELPDWQRRLNTLLPAGGNSQARIMAKQWRQQVATDKAYIDYLLNWYNKAFYYTLQPPPVGPDVIDGFLFSSKRGFCEHFASSFVFMLRAAGIPARVVVGYQGGEYNAYENYYLVRQYDAHAWAEVWIEGAGWVRYDPTFAVAPQRILDGFREAFDQSNELNLPLLSLDRYRNVKLMNWLSKQADRINYNWVRFVLSYDAEKQTSLLSGLLGEYSIFRVAVFTVAAVTILLVLLYGMLWWQERDHTVDPVLKQYRHFCRDMARKGLPLRQGETPRQYLQRIASGQSMDVAAQSLIQQYYDIWYAGTEYSAEKLYQLHKDTDSWRKQIRVSVKKTTQ